MGGNTLALGVVPVGSEASVPSPWVPEGPISALLSEAPTWVQKTMSDRKIDPGVVGSTVRAQARALGGWG